MSTCKACRTYYRLSAHNNTANCDDCMSIFGEDDLDIDPAFEADVIELVNPTGRTKPVFFDDDSESMQ